MGGQVRAEPARPAGGARRVTWAGILLILAGIVGFIMAGYTLATADEIMALAEEIYGSQVEGMESVVYVLAGFWAICGAMSMLGGLFALRRQHYALVVIGAVLAIFTGGFFFEGTIMGLIALVLVLRSRQEFR